jgi:ABC-2 type transport system ATP-binding protein
MFSLRISIFAAALCAAALAACSGGGATIGSVGNAGSVPSGGSGASPAPKTGSTTAPTPTPSPTPGSGSSTQTGAIAAPTAPPYDSTSPTTVVPAVPASGCRAGSSYSVYVDSAPTDISATGSLEAFTVFEPSQICAGQTYPLIFNGPGFGGSRTSAAGSFSSFTSAGYGVISVDEAGEGNDGGKIRVMDPDQEGVMLMAVMNWAQVKLSWLAYGPTNDGTDPHEPIYGTDGGSYGGMYQFMLVNIDKRHRIRAMVPQITPADLNFSLFQGGAIKTLWDAELFADGQTAGDGVPEADFDPYVDTEFASDFAQNAEDAGFQDFMGYHSADYFCNGTPIATNGNDSLFGAPALPPTTAPPKVNALIWIGVRDTLFNFDNGYKNYQCMQRGGGDVRLLSYQTGHNAQVENDVPVGTVPDPYVALFYPNNDSLDSRCGTLSEATAELDWFNQYLKGQSGAANAIPQNPCISLEAGDGITVPTISTYTSGPAEKPYPVSASIVAGVSPDVAEPGLPNVVPLYTATGPDVVAGIPHVVVDLASVAGVTVNQPIVYVGLGVLHASNPSVYDLMDNEVTPLRGTGHFDVDLVGGGIRMVAGDKLALLVFGEATQYAATGTVHVTEPVPQPVTLTGTVYVPDLGPVPSNI